MSRAVLKWRVECYDPELYCAWEPIAAFNNEAVARGYGQDCLRGAIERDLRFAYRVVAPRNKVIWEGCHE